MGGEVAVAFSVSGRRCVRDLIHIIPQGAVADADGWRVTASVATVEAYVTRCLARLIEIRQDDRSAFEGELLNQQRVEIFRSWDSRLSWLNKGFGIALQSLAATQQMRIANEVRNALVHGNAHLTDLQTQDLSKMIALKRDLLRVLDVHCVGRRVVLGERTLRLISDVSVRFVCAVEDRIRSAYPGLEF